MSESLTVRRRPDDWTDDHDWLGEFVSEPAPTSRLLAEATTLPVLTRTALPKFRRGRRMRAQKRTRLRLAMLLMACSLMLLVSAGTVAISQWMRVARAPVPVAEWPVSPPSILPATGTTSGQAIDTPARELASEIAPAEAVPPLPTPPAAATDSKPAAVATSAAGAAGPFARPTAPGPAPVSTGNEVSDILSVLERYRLAFGSLNPASVRAVLPAADTRALARQFADIKRQTLALDNCQIDVQGVQAKAICAGRVSLVTRSGSPVSSIQTRRWVFTLAYQKDAWKIRTVDSTDR